MRRVFSRDRDRPSIDGYEDFELIGRGGFSRVYRATQPAFDRQVAVKVITATIDASDLDRFSDELRITGRLDGHPNVIRVYESGRTRAGRPFLAMELFEDGTYGQWLRRHGPLRVPDVLALGVKVAGALQAAHDRSIIHRDVKPQNILRSPFVGPVLADFGIAGLLERRGAIAAGGQSEAFSVLHAAPEVLAGEPATPAADLYSLGSSLYELLTGTPPFHDPAAPGVLDVLARVDAGAVAPISRPDLPAPAAAEIASLLARNVADRPSSGVELASRLQALEADLGLPVTEIPGQHGAGAGRFRRRSGPTPTPAPPPETPETPAPPPSDGNDEDPAPHTLVPGDSPAGATPPVPRPRPVRRRSPATADTEHTVERRPPAPPPRPEDPAAERPRRWPCRLAIGAGALVVVGALTAAVLALTSHDPEEEPRPRTTTTTEPPAVAPAPPPCPQEGVPPLDSPDGAQPAPTDITVTRTDEGLRVAWTDRTGGAGGHVVLVRCDDHGELITTPLAAVEAGGSTAAITGVGDDQRWCVSVGAVQPGAGSRLPDGPDQFACVDS